MEALAHRGPDGRVTTVVGRAAFGVWHHWTTPEEVGHQQPVADPAARSRGGRWLIFEGRIDNRDELRLQLQGDPALDGETEPPDGLLLLAAFRRWGDDFLERVVGPLAVVLYDEAEQSVLCARDALGDRTLFLYLDEERLAVASEEAALLALVEIDGALDEGRLASHFGLRIPDDGRTFFRGIRELLPGHYLRVGLDEETERPFYSPPLGSPLVYRRDDDYAEHFSATLHSAVEARSRATTPPALLLSGGLDSSSVAACAAETLNASKEQPLTVFWWTFDRHQSCDERPYQRAFARLYPVRPVEIPGDDCWALGGDGWGRHPSSPEDNPYRRLKGATYRAAAEAGHSVLLTGIFGDQAYSGANAAFLELMLAGRFGQAAREWWWQFRARGWWGAWAWTGIRARLFGHRDESAPPPWLTAEASSALPAPAPFPPARRPDQASSLLGPRAARSASAESPFASRAGIELRHPYRDRRLVELMLRLPASQLLRDGSYKHVVRRAFRQRLPTEILERRGSASLAPLFEEGIADREVQRVRRLLDSPAATWRRYVREDWLEAALRRGPADPLGRLVLWQVLSYELWRHHGQASGTSSPPEALP